MAVIKYWYLAGKNRNDMNTVQEDSYVTYWRILYSESKANSVCKYNMNVTQNCQTMIVISTMSGNLNSTFVLAYQPLHQ